MSTNYYLRPVGACETKCSNWVHLGKSSGGWGFSFRAYPDADSAPGAVTWPVTDFASWLKLLKLGEIYDEYGQPVTDQELLSLIVSKRGGKNTCYRNDFLDEDGNRFCPEYFS